MTERTTTRRGIDGFAGNLADWSREVGERAPGYARIVEAILELLAASDPAGEDVRAVLEDAWGARSFDASYDRPLLFFAALRDEALREGWEHPLWASLGTEGSDPQSVTRARVAAALAPNRAQLARTLRERSVQTNESSRAVAWLWPAHLLGASSGRRPIALVDVGASAGLNLLADALPAIWKDDQGRELPVARDLDLRLRLGLDRRPLDALDPGTARWLEACIWAGERDRIERLRAGVEALREARARGGAPVLETAEAAAIPERIAERTRALPAGMLVLAYQTMTVEYFPPADRAAYVAGMEAWIARTPGTAWIQLERDLTGDRSLPASIRATIGAGDGSSRGVLLARCGYHPRIVRPIADGVLAVAAR